MIYSPEVFLFCFVFCQNECVSLFNVSDLCLVETVIAIDSNQKSILQRDYQFWSFVPNDSPSAAAGDSANPSLNTS